MLGTGQKETAKLQPKCNESGDKSLIFFYLQLSKGNKLSNSAMCSSPLFPSPKSIVLKGQVEEKRTIGPVLFLPAGGWVVQVGSTARRRRWWSLYWDFNVVCRKGRGGETHWEDVQMKQGLQHHDYIKEWFYAVGFGLLKTNNHAKKQIQSPKLQNHFLQKAKLMPSSRCKTHHKLNYNGELGMALGSLLHGAEKSSWQLPAPVLYCWWGLAVTTKGKYYCFTSQGFYYQQTTNPPFLSSIEWSLRAASQVALKLPPRHACLTQQEKCWLLLTSKCDWSGWIWKQGAPLV